MIKPPLEKNIVESFVLSVTLPILLDLESSVELLATGTLFKVSERHFLVTARYVFEGVSKPENLAYPEAPLRGATHTFGKSVSVKPDDENMDVAVVLLDEPATVERLEKSWQFLTLKTLPLPPSMPLTDTSSSQAIPPR